MVRRQQPPLPSAIRPLYWAVRAIGVVVGGFGLYVVGLAATRGSWVLALIVLIIGGGFVALTWMHPLSRWFVPTLAGLAFLAGSLAVVLLRSWLLALVIGVPVAFVLWARRRPFAIRGPDLDPDNVTIAEPSAVMKNARDFVEQFTLAGFVQVGALRFSVGPFKVIESLLLAPDGLSYAAVTDSIVHVTSLFPDGRGLVTRNSDYAVVPDYLLVDSAPGGIPTELIMSHTKALALVAERDHYPIPIAAPELQR